MSTSNKGDAADHFNHATSNRILLKRAAPRELNRDRHGFLQFSVRRTDTPSSSGNYSDSGERVKIHLAASRTGTRPVPELPKIFLTPFCEAAKPSIVASDKIVRSFFTLEGQRGATETN